MNRTRRSAWWCLATAAAALSIAACTGGSRQEATSQQSAPAPAAAARATKPAEPSVSLVRSRDLGEGTAKLSWAAPEPQTGAHAANDEIVGYAIYVGPSPDALALEAIITGPSVRQYVVDKLPRGKHYFAVTSFARSGAESEKSAIGSKVID